MTILRHKISDDILVRMNGNEVWSKVERTCCGLDIEHNSISFPLSATYVGEYNCEECKRGYALEMLARLP